VEVGQFHRRLDKC